MRSRIRQEATDGSLGPLLRIAEDTLDAGEGYGRHAHRDVDVVAVVVSGELLHKWDGRGPRLRAGDVGVLRAGAGLAHDEVAGDDGAHVVQAYLRAADPGAPPGHEVRPAPSGWVDLGRPDARLWLAAPGPGEEVAPPPGVWVVYRDGEVTVAPGEGTLVGPATVGVWQVDRTRPAWAD